MATSCLEAKEYRWIAITLALTSRFVSDTAFGVDGLRDAMLEREQHRRRYRVGGVGQAEEFVPEQIRGVSVQRAALAVFKRSLLVSFGPSPLDNPLSHLDHGIVMPLLKQK